EHKSAPGNRRHLRGRLHLPGNRVLAVRNPGRDDRPGRRHPNPGRAALAGRVRRELRRSIKRMNWKQVSAAAALAASLAMAPPALGQLAESVAAVVNDHVISTFDVRQRANLLIVSAGLQSTPELQERASAQALHDLVDERLEEEE